MLRRRIFLFFALIIAAPGAYAQLYNFKNYNVDQGLPEGAIRALCQDRRGNLLIGTTGAGLIRYDGFSFQTFLREEGLTSNFIHAVYEDATGQLWIGTEEGLYLYDGIRLSAFKGIGNSIVRAITSDRSRRIWLGTDDGLYQVKGSVITRYTTQHGLPDNDITCLFVHTNEELWVGTMKGVAHYGAGASEFFTTDNGLSGNVIHAIAEDRSGTLWIATGSGLSTFHDAGITNHQIRKGSAAYVPLSIVRDHDGDLWIGTTGGIFKFNGKTFDYHQSSQRQGEDFIHCSFADAEGNLWFGTSEKGLTRLDSERFIHYPENDQMGKRVYAVIQALNGNLICGTSLGGTTVFDGTQYALLDAKEGFTSSIVQSFFYTPDSTLWVGTQDEGVFRFSKTGSQNYTAKDLLPSNNITGFAIDAASHMWVASADSGVTVFRLHSADSVQRIARFTARNGLGSNRISTIASDGSNTVWIGTEDNGINRIVIPDDTIQQPQVYRFDVSDGLTSNIIHCIKAGPRKEVYIGTSKGLLIYPGGSFKKVTKADGLRSDNIFSLALGKDGSLWAGTEQGVERITFSTNPGTPSISHFGYEEGFKGVEVYRNSSCIDREGNIWFGTVNGLVKYNPLEELSHDISPRIHLTGIKLFFDDAAHTRYVDSVTAWYRLPQELNLPHDQNNLTFSYAGILLRNPSAARYRWMLEGLNESWSPPVTGREVTFSNLSPGEYSFKVIASNEFGSWTKEPATFDFRIDPPLWQRWWIQFPAVALVLGMIWGAFSLRIRRIKAKEHAIRERLEMENSILQLEQEAARLQMNPHFIFNCLNSIQGFISTNDAFQAKKYLAKFARLMRLILENAREEFIPLTNEIHILENYMELEKLTTNQPFAFSITVDEAVDAERIQIPPMMIQPFVENAIVHGVKKKNAPGEIRIHFRLNGQMLECEVTDNGVGRKRSAEMNRNSRQAHKSTGISVTTKRLEQYGQQGNLPAGVRIIDLEENGLAAGTSVIISTPFEGD
jgi:ligand-binding sensor domain-containing protein